MTGGDGHCRILIRLFRLWAMAREDGEITLRRMHQAANEFSLPVHTAAACASLFALVENALARRMTREQCCAPRFSPDESALIGVIEAAPSLGAMQGSGAVPHGLPGAIRWAALCVRDALAWPRRVVSSSDDSISSCGCPCAASARTPTACP